MIPDDDASPILIPAPSGQLLHSKISRAALVPPITGSSRKDQELKAELGLGDSEVKMYGNEKILFAVDDKDLHGQIPQQR